MERCPFREEEELATDVPLLVTDVDLLVVDKDFLEGVGLEGGRSTRRLGLVPGVRRVSSLLVMNRYVSKKGEETK